MAYGYWHGPSLLGSGGFKLCLCTAKVSHQPEDPETLKSLSTPLRDLQGYHKGIRIGPLMGCAVQRAGFRRVHWEKALQVEKACKFLLQPVARFDSLRIPLPLFDSSSSPPLLMYGIRIHYRLLPLGSRAMAHRWHSSMASETNSWMSQGFVARHGHMTIATYKQVNKKTGNKCKQINTDNGLLFQVSQGQVGCCGLLV